MFTKPLSIRDLYVLSGVLSFIFVSLTVVVTQSTATLWFALLFPFIFVTIRLVLLSDSYTEENLTLISRRVFAVFTGFVSLVVLSIVLLRMRLISVLWTVILYGLTIAPFFLLEREVGESYSEIEFGFRAILPETDLWKSATVFLYNGETATNPITKFVWYALAHRRFVALSQSLDPTDPYSNHTIAKAYREATNVSLSDNNLVPDETEFGPIFEAFTNQQCVRCEESKPVSDMYLLTDDGVLSEAFCSACIEDTQPTSTVEQETEETERDAPSSTLEGESVDFALQVFGYTPSEFEDVTPEELRARYRELVQEKHPDTGGNEDEFKLVLNAYEELEERVTNED